MNKKILSLVTIFGISTMLLFWSVVPSVSAIDIDSPPFTAFEDGFSSNGCLPGNTCEITHVTIALDVDTDGRCTDNDPRITVPISTIDVTNLKPCEYAGSDRIFKP